MTQGVRIGIYAAAAAAASYTIPMAVSKAMYDKIFNRRAEAKPEPVAAKLTDFPDMARRAATFLSDRGQMLKGYFYYQKDADSPFERTRGLIVMSHGIYQGHVDYLGDFDRFTKAGFTVFGFDGTGCMESGGTRLIGLDQAVIDLHYALLYLEKRKELANVPVLLYGHSMGAYAAAAVLNYGHGHIAGVAARSGFDDPMDMIREVGVKLYGKTAFLVLPFLLLYRKLLFRGHTLYGGLEGLKKAGLPALILHSDDDPVVELPFSLYERCEREKEELVHVRTYLCHKKGHDIVRSDSALLYYDKVDRMKRELDKRYGQEKKVPKAVMEDFYRHVDMKRLNVLDGEILSVIENFMSECADRYEERCASSEARRA